ERLNDPASKRWDVRLVTAVKPDTINQRTFVTWSEPLGSNTTAPATHNPCFYALRQRASLFGYNAIDPRMLSDPPLGALRCAKFVVDNEWDFGTDKSTSIIPTNRKKLADESLVDLDAVYSKLAVGGWLALIHPDAHVARSPAGFVSLYLLKSVTPITRSDY